MIGIVDSTGASVAEYLYDAWGQILDTAGAMADLNPIRYRGYYYDGETGLYYLQSRYYDPVIGRFINADDAGTLGADGEVLSYNLFAYCGNNPIQREDSSGYWSFSSFLAAIAVAAVVVAVVAACVAAAPVAAAVGGSVLGSTALAAAATTTATTAAEIAVVAAAGSIVAEKKERRNNSVYVLRDSTGDVQYVGRTTNVSVRKNAHNLNPARRGLKMEVIASGLNYDEARALEQAGMIYYHTINPSNKTNNQINGIAPTKWNKYKGVAQKVISYGENMMTNELLYWLGM